MTAEMVEKNPIEYKGLFIHEYNYEADKFGYAIAYEEKEVFIDEEEAISQNMTTEQYQEALNKFEAKQYHHVFEYGVDDNKDVQDSYFLTLDACKKAIDYLASI